MAQTDVNTAFYRILAPRGMSEYFILPSVSTQLLLREGVKVPDHLRHLSGVSPQRQVLAKGFSCALYFCLKIVECCVRLAVFSADALLTDRHRASVMTRDSVCFGVYVNGVCAVGCNRPKVLAALEAVKATSDAAYLQCSEVEADTSKQILQVFSWITKPGYCRWKLRVSGGCDMAWSSLRVKNILLETRWPK